LRTATSSISSTACRSAPKSWSVTAQASKAT
jgi:hypothetical protein